MQKMPCGITAGIFLTYGIGINHQVFIRLQHSFGVKHTLWIKLQTHYW